MLAAAAKHLTPVVLELGGKSPVVVDSNIDYKVIFLICSVSELFERIFPKFMIISFLNFSVYQFSFFCSL